MKKIKQKSLKNIIIGILNGDLQAKQEFVDRFNAKLWKLSYQLDNEEVEDTYQNLLVFIFELLPKLSLDKFTEGGLVNYINISLKHELIHLRSKTYNRVVNETELTEEQYKLEEKYQEITTYLLLKEVKSILTKEEWQLLVEIEILDVPMKELSKKYKVSVQALYQHKKRIINKKEF